MTGFGYGRDGLMAEDLSLASLARTHGTPLYVYSAATIRARFAALAGAFEGLPALICYAVKANSNLAIIRLLADLGAGADTVSGGEILRALAAGVPPGRIVFAGVAKTDEDLRFALETGIHQFNVESIEELRRLAAIAESMGLRAPVALRVNPDVAAATHEKISTGRKGDKFGIAFDDGIEAARLACRLAGIALKGLHLHIGSQITSTAPFETAYGRIAELARALRAQGIAIERLDLGGGFGVDYGEGVVLSPAELGRVVRAAIADLGCELLFEPGRFLVAEAGVLVSSVIDTKIADGRRFAILDAGMNNLLRPAMYGARHEIRPLLEPRSPTEQLTMDVVGPICESSDLFGRDYRLPRLAAGDLVAVMGCGAYGSVMASDYNSRPRAAELLVDGDRAAVIKRRHEPAEFFADETIPSWLAASGA